MSEKFSKIGGPNIRNLATKLIALLEAGNKSGPFYRRCSELLALIYSNESSRIQLKILNHRRWTRYNSSSF